VKAFPNYILSLFQVHSKTFCKLGFWFQQSPNIFNGDFSDRPTWPAACFLASAVNRWVEDRKWQSP